MIIKNNKSQLTIFIILVIAIFLILAGFLIFYDYGENLKIIIKENINPDIKPVYDFVTKCIKEVGEDAVYQIGKTGGYIEPPEPKINFAIFFYSQNL